MTTRAGGTIVEQEPETVRIWWSPYDGIAIDGSMDPEMNEDEQFRRLAVAVPVHLIRNYRHAEELFDQAFAAVAEWVDEHDPSHVERRAQEGER